jgi:hypothetical protein
MKSLPAQLLFLIPLAWLGLRLGEQPALGSPPPRQPNILFLLTDDQRWDTLRCAGNRIIQVTTRRYNQFGPGAR